MGRKRRRYSNRRVMTRRNQRLEKQVDIAVNCLESACYFPQYSSEFLFLGGVALDERSLSDLDVIEQTMRELEDDLLRNATYFDMETNQCFLGGG